MDVLVRPAVEADADAVWVLMRDLAVFEQYIDDFVITPEIVREQGFRKSPPDFYCLVAEAEGQIVGLAVYYFYPFTAQNKPVLYMKELYVQEAYRGQKVGERLIEALKRVAQERGSATLTWKVAPWNARGIQFYERLGARQNTRWLTFDLPV